MSTPARSLDDLSILTIHEALGGVQGKTIAGEVYGTCWGAHQNGTAHTNLRLNEERGTYACHCLGDTGGGGKLDLVIFAGKTSDHSSASKYLVEIGVLAPPVASNGTASIVTTPRRTTASFEYLNEDGTPFARVDRVEPGKSGKGKDFYPKLWEGGGYRTKSGLDGKKCPLYGIPQLRAGIEEGSLVFFCEGEGNVTTLTGALRKGNVEAVATTIQGGTPAKLTGEHFTQLRGAQGVVVMLDADDKGREAGKLRAEQIARKTGANVRIIDLYPDRTDGSDLVDWLREGHTIEQLLAIVKQAPTLSTSTAVAPPAAQPSFYESDDTRPAISAGEGDLTAITALAVDALIAVNGDAHIVRYAGSLCRLERDDYGALTPVRLSTKHVRDELARAAHWYRLRKVKTADSEESETVAVPAFPSTPVCDNVLVQAVKPFPVLAAIVDVPTFAPDGTLQTTRGYDAKTKTFYDPAPGMADLTIPTNPTEDEIAQARDLLLDDFMGDFIFASDLERANAVGAILTPFIQYADIFPVPAACYEAPIQASGKTKLAKLSLGIGSGSRLKETGMQVKEEETAKSITTALLSNYGTLIIDNIEGKYASPTLSFALTSDKYTARLLGGNEDISVPWRLIVVLTANNAVFDADLVRRSYRIRLDPGMERPQDREGFRHENLEEWCKENRPRLAAAALTLISAWVAAGRPKGTATKGSFERWARTIGGILNLVGIPGFLQNDRLFSETANRDGDEIRSFVAAWYAEFQEREVGTKALLPLAEDLPLGDGTDPAKRKKLGMFLAKYRDRVFNVGEDGSQLSLCLRKAKGVTDGSARWQIVKGRGPGDTRGPGGANDEKKKKSSSYSSSIEYALDAGAHGSPYVPWSPSESTVSPENAVGKDGEAHKFDHNLGFADVIEI